MNARELYEQYEKDKEEQEKRDFLLKDRLSVEECWSSHENSFYHWMNLFYYHELLNYIRSRNSLFRVWQDEYGLDDFELKKFGISNCVSGKVKYIYIAHGENVLRNFVSELDYIPDKTTSGPYFNCRYFRIKDFIPFNTWIKDKGYSGDVPQVSITYGWKKSAFRTDFVEVNMLNGFQALKMGGIVIENPLGDNLRVKRVQFVNLERLGFVGQITTGGRELYISDCFVNGLTLFDCDFALVVFERCQIEDLRIKNSSLQSWSFYDCNISGTIESSNLTDIIIKGGRCDIVLNDVKLSGVHGENSEGQLVTRWFRVLKSAYQSQGNDELAMHYFIREKENQRLYLKYSLQPLFKKRYQYSFSLLLRVLNIIRRYLSLSISKFYWGYSKKPVNVIYSSFCIVTLYTLIYIIQYFWSSGDISLNLWGVLKESVGVSVSSFTTLGYFSNTDFVKELSSYTIISESIFGAISFGALVGTLANQKY